MNKNNLNPFEGLTLVEIEALKKDLEIDESKENFKHNTEVINNIDNLIENDDDVVFENDSGDSIDEVVNNIIEFNKLNNK